MNFLDKEYKLQELKEFSNNLANNYNLKLLIGKDIIINIIKSLHNTIWTYNGCAQHLPAKNGLSLHIRSKKKYCKYCEDCGLIFNNIDFSNSTKRCNKCSCNPSPPKTQITLVKNNELYFDKISAMMSCNYDIITNNYVKQIIHNKNLNNILKEYFKCDYYCNHACIFHNENNGKSNILWKQMYHIDEADMLIQKKYNFCKMFIPLCDVDENNGVLTIVKNSSVIDGTPPIDIESLLKSPAQRFTDEFIKKTYPKSDIIPLNAKMGEVYLVRTDGIHKGGFVKKGKRTVLFLQFKTK